MSAGHTPGPWSADFHNEQREGGRFITYVRGGNQLVPIAAVPTGVEGYGRDEGRANAQLMASAPEMLEVLYQYVSDLRYPPQGDSIQRRIERAEAAIARATGAAS